MNKKSNVQAVSTVLTELGLVQLWAEIFQPGSPLAFLTAQGLRVAQPVLNVFATTAGSASLAALANRLEAPPTLDDQDLVEEFDK